MGAIIVRFQFSDFRAPELIEYLKTRYGGGLNYIAEGTILIDTFDSAEDLFTDLQAFFTFDDKLFVGELSDYKSLHKVSRTKPSTHKVAV
ncbi:MAG: hypothetical protein U0176_00660 [Bacteroidia bacterium]